jgi:hypothetical protein
VAKEYWLSRLTVMPDDWHNLKTTLVAHLGRLEPALRAGGHVDAAKLFAPVSANPPESQFGSASDWLGEVELVAEAVLRRFPPPPPLDAQVREAHRLARLGLYHKFPAG